MISGMILLVCVTVMALNLKFISLEMTAIIGALVCVLTGCLTEKQAYSSIDWVTIFLFAGMMPVSTAMDKTGAGKLIANWAVGLMGGEPTPLIVTIVLFSISCFLTQFMSNTASAALLCPIGIAIAKQLNADPKAVVMGDCCCCILRIRNSCWHSALYSGARSRRLQIYGLCEMRNRFGAGMLCCKLDCYSDGMAVLP